MPRLTDTEKYNREKVGLFTNGQYEILQNHIDRLERRCVASKASFLTLDHILSLLIPPGDHDICRRVQTLFPDGDFRSAHIFRYEGVAIQVDTNGKLAFPSATKTTFYINEKSEEAALIIREWIGWAVENRRKWGEVRIALGIVRSMRTLQVAGFYWSALPSLLRHCGFDKDAEFAERPLKNFDRLQSLSFAHRKLMAETPGTLAAALFLPGDALKQEVSLRLIN